MLRELIINDQAKIVERYKPDIAIELLRDFEPLALEMHPDGYYAAYSGGKDSDIMLDLLIKADVKFSVHYGVTGIDPIEAIKHIKQTRIRLAEQNIKLYMEPPKKFTTGIYKGLPYNMWRLIVHKMMPPTRICRYCCDKLKEGGGKGRICLTGVRWAESVKRKNNRNTLEIMTSNRKNKMLFNDNDEGRRQFETCIKKGKRILNPIVSWSHDDVWEYIEQEHVEVCKLYSQGVDRIGCIGCPMGGPNGMEEDFYRYPWAKELYLKAFAKMIEYRDTRNLPPAKFFTSPEAIMEWWMYGSDKEQENIIEGQIEIFEWFGLIDELEDAI